MCDHTCTNNAPFRPDVVHFPQEKCNIFPLLISLHKKIHDAYMSWSDPGTSHRKRKIWGWDRNEMWLLKISDEASHVTSLLLLCNLCRRNGFHCQTVATFLGPDRHNHGTVNRLVQLWGWDYDYSASVIVFVSMIKIHSSFDRCWHAKHISAEDSS